VVALCSFELHAQSFEEREHIVLMLKSILEVS
jgi:hypothetical protein